MKVHLTWMVVSALVAVGLNSQPACAQYAPYRPQQPLQQTAAGYPTTSYPTTGQPAVTPAAPSTAYRAPAVQAQLPQAQAPPAAPAASAATYGYQIPAATAAPRTAQTAAQIPAYTYPQVAQSPTYSSTPSTAGYPTYPVVARQPATPIPAESNSPSAPAPAAPEHSVAAPTDTSAAAGPAESGNGYPSTGYQTGSGYNGYGQNSCGYTDYGIAGACETEGPGHVWFGGVYALGMERDDPSVRKLTVRVDHDVATDPYYPQANTTVLSTHETGFNFQEGVEVRFGSTFSIGSACDTGCGSGCGGCAPMDEYAWEIGWWAIDEDSQRATYADPDWSDNVRSYGMVNFAGLQIDRDGDDLNWRPVNDYYGYGLPIDAPVAPVDGDIIVLAQQVRQYFSSQSLELNLIRFPVCGTSCGSGCGSSCATGCNTGCANTCGYDLSGCEPACNPLAFSMYGMCGVRYFRTDDDFYYCTEFGEWGGGAYDQIEYDGFTGDSSNELFYDVQVDNNLVGPQLGWNMNYCYSKWNFFCNSTFGIFNNHIQNHQRVWAGGGGGNAQIAQTGQTYVVNSSKDDISFLGELRLGGSYDISCNWRGVLAYRAVAITGVANSTDQIPTDFTNLQYPGIIDSDSSIVIHGVQVGAECRY